MAIDDHRPVELVALRFLRAVEEVAQRLPSWRAYLAVQMRRAALSVYLNLREGGAEFTPGEKAKFYRYSLRSLREAVGCLIVAFTFHPALTEFTDVAITIARELAPSVGRMAVFHQKRTRNEK